MLIQKGSRLGNATNNIAEAHGLTTALRTCLHFLFWVIEQISHLSRRIMSDSMNSEDTLTDCPDMGNSTREKNRIALMLTKNR